MNLNEAGFIILSENFQENAKMTGMNLSETGFMILSENFQENAKMTGMNLNEAGFIIRKLSRECTNYRNELK